MYTLLILAQNGQKIHQWNWATSTAIDITSLITGGGGGGSAPVIGNPKLTGTTFTLATSTEIGFNYVLEYKIALSDSIWISVQTNSGSGAQIGLTNFGAVGPSRVYRVRVQ